MFYEGGAMSLKDYLHFNDIKCVAMARQLGITGHYLRMIRLMKLKPSLELAEKIEIITGGEVTVKELRG